MNTPRALDSILDEVIAWSSPPTLEKGEFTVKNYIARLEATKGVTLSKGAARGRLDYQVDQGHLAKRIVSQGTTRVAAYRVIKEDKVDITHPS